jgi:riboflavin synthase
MFSGIVEAKAKLLKFTPHDPSQLSALIKIEKPNTFNDLKTGDSIAVNGICLTVISFDDDTISFDLGTETLKICQGMFGKNQQVVSTTTQNTVTRHLMVAQGSPDSEATFNLERSLKLGDRIHGHIVTGHVDGIARVINFQPSGSSQTLTIQLDDMHAVPVNGNSLLSMIWKKGSLTVNGVSLTVNDVSDSSRTVEFCLIPETLSRTNLGQIKVGDTVTIEIDQMARGLSRRLHEQHT